jgi:hypothetical protein
VKNVLPLHPMLERRRHKYNFRLHALNLAQNGEKSKHPKPPCLGLTINRSATSKNYKKGDNQ